MEYQKFYFNCIIGRVANRIANACFQMDDRIYDISMNAQPDSLHGGVKGFDQVFSFDIYLIYILTHCL